MPCRIVLITGDITALIGFTDNPADRVISSPRGAQIRVSGDGQTVERIVGKARGVAIRIGFTGEITFGIVNHRGEAAIRVIGARQSAIGVVAVSGNAAQRIDILHFVTHFVIDLLSDIAERVGSLNQSIERVIFKAGGFIGENAIEGALDGFGEHVAVVAVGHCRDIAEWVGLGQPVAIRVVGVVGDAAKSVPHPGNQSFTIDVVYIGCKAQRIRDIGKVADRIVVVAVGDAFRVCDGEFLAPLIIGKARAAI